MKNLAQKIFGLMLSVILVSGVAFAQQEVNIVTTDLGSGVYLLKGQGGNIGLFVGEDGVFMIDDQFAPLSDKIKAAVADISDQPVKFIINTHWHGDHTGGNENFAKSGSVIVAHENVRKRMSTKQVIKAFNREVPASAQQALPVITFTEQVNFHINGDDLNVIHVPNAHTDGDAIIHFIKANIIHMGDTLFNGNYPFIDIGSGGSIQGYLQNLENVIELADDKTQIIPGHGVMSNKSSLILYHAMLADIHNNYKILKEQGKSLEEITEIGISKKYDEKYGNGFIKPESLLNFIHASSVEKLDKAKLIQPNKTDLHDHGAGQSAH